MSWRVYPPIAPCGRGLRLIRGVPKLARRQFGLTPGNCSRELLGGSSSSAQAPQIMVAAMMVANRFRLSIGPPVDVDGGS